MLSYDLLLGQVDARHPCPCVSFPVLHSSEVIVVAVVLLSDVEA